MKLAELPQRANDVRTSVQETISGVELPEINTSALTQAAAGAAEAAAERAASLGARAKELGAEATTAVLAAQAARPRRRLPKHPVRTTVLIALAGATAAYFADPAAGARRRETVRRKFSGAARVTGQGLDQAGSAAQKVSAAAHKAADVADPAPTSHTH